MPHVDDALGVDGEDVVGPLGLCLAERADRHRAPGQHEEVAFGLQRRRHVALDPHAAAVQCTRPGGEPLPWPVVDAHQIEERELDHRVLEFDDLISKRPNFEAWWKRVTARPSWQLVQELQPKTQ